MKAARSPSTGRRYPLTMICQIWHVARSTVYATAGAPARLVLVRKRGPKPVVSDEVLMAAIRDVLAVTPFHGEGYRKVRARLAHRGLAVSGKRVLRLMRQHQLLAPRRLGPPNGDPSHAGTIVTSRPNQMWGTDATRFYTEQEGWCWFFGAIDHYSADIVGWHVAKIGDRWAALEPLREGMRELFGGARKDAARGLQIRCDWGPQYIADAWIAEVKWLGMTITPSYVGEPQCNGDDSSCFLERLEAMQVEALFLQRPDEALDHRGSSAAAAVGAAARSLALATRAPSWGRCPARRRPLAGAPRAPAARAPPAPAVP
jgi:transposase InsO family protein